MTTKMKTNSEIFEPFETKELLDEIFDRGHQDSILNALSFEAIEDYMEDMGYCVSLEFGSGSADKIIQEMFVLVALDKPVPRELYARLFQSTMKVSL